MSGYYLDPGHHRRRCHRSHRLCHRRRHVIIDIVVVVVSSSLFNITVVILVVNVVVVSSSLSLSLSVVAWMYRSWQGSNLPTVARLRAPLAHDHSLHHMVTLPTFVVRTNWGMSGVMSLTTHLEQYLYIHIIFTVIYVFSAFHRCTWIEK